MNLLEIMQSVNESIADFINDALLVSPETGMSYYVSRIWYIKDFNKVQINVTFYYPEYCEGDILKSYIIDADIILQYLTSKDPNIPKYWNVFYNKQEKK